MPVERYFLEDSFQLNAEKTLTGSEFHHLWRVMRARLGDSVEIVNGRGALAHALVEKIAKDRAVLRIKKIEEMQPEKSTVILAQAFPKVNRLDFILEKGTELGVDEFWLFPGVLSIKKDFTVNQLERAQMLTIAAMKQCGRLTLPKVKIMPSLDQWPSPEGSVFFGDVNRNAPVFWHAWNQNEIISPLTFFIGPESGWHAQEVQLLKKIGGKPVKLHDNILRTDTASLAAISLVRHWLMQPFRNNPVSER